jgi:hypothetical protein
MGKESTIAPGDGTALLAAVGKIKGDTPWFLPSGAKAEPNRYK